MLAKILKRDKETMSLPILKNQWGTQITPLLREKWEEEKWVMWLADLMKEIGIDPDSEDEKQESDKSSENEN